VAKNVGSAVVFRPDGRSGPAHACRQGAAGWKVLPGGQGSRRWQCSCFTGASTGPPGGCDPHRLARRHRVPRELFLFDPPPRSRPGRGRQAPARRRRPIRRPSSPPPRPAPRPARTWDPPLSASTTRSTGGGAHSVWGRPGRRWVRSTLGPSVQARVFPWPTAGPRPGSTPPATLAGAGRAARAGRAAARERLLEQTLAGGRPDGHAVRTLDQARRRCRQRPRSGGRTAGPGPARAGEDANAGVVGRPRLGHRPSHRDPTPRSSRSGLPRQPCRSVASGGGAAHPCMPGGWKRPSTASQPPSTTRRLPVT
jgi:hypothetical protein